MSNGTFILMATCILQFQSNSYMQYLRKFILSEGSPDMGFDSWSFMMRTTYKEFALIYFENDAELPVRIYISR